MPNSRNDKCVQFADIFKALSNPHRLKIFFRLVDCSGKGGEFDCEKIRSCVGTIGADLGIVPSTVSHHIKELQYAGLIITERRGKHMDCQIDLEALELLEEFFGDISKLRKKLKNERKK